MDLFEVIQIVFSIEPTGLSLLVLVLVLVSGRAGAVSKAQWMARWQPERNPSRAEAMRLAKQQAGNERVDLSFGWYLVWGLLVSG